MTLGNTIAENRKRLGITQEALARQLNVTNQAISKWESDQCYPDIMLLPRLADIFGISLDALFGREAAAEESLVLGGLPWADDETLRGVVYQGHRLLGHTRSRTFPWISVKTAIDVQCDFKLECGEVRGNVVASGDVSCGSVGGDVNAGGSVNCGDVGGDVDAGENINCGDVDGNADAGGDLSCGNVEGDVDAGGSVTCGNVGGDVDAGANVSCLNVEGDVDAGGTLVIKR